MPRLRVGRPTSESDTNGVAISLKGRYLLTYRHLRRDKRPGL
jgi:hypothetical protein